MIKYAIDANALINACHSYMMGKRSFAHIWNRIQELIDEGSLVSSIEVRTELKDADLIEWSKHNVKMFKPLTQDVQEKAIEILKRFPNLIKLRSTSNSNADPFLIATAATEGAIVVSDERFGDAKNGDYRIPNVCKEMGIECISFRTFIDQILD